MLLAPPRSAQAQTTLTPSAGLSDSYKPDRWMPVQVALSNQGQPAKVEVRARFSHYNGAVYEYRLPPREMPSNANQLHTLYIKAPQVYSAQPLTLELYRDGRRINEIKPTLRPLNPGDWLALGIGPTDSLKQLTNVTLTPQQMAPGSKAWMGSNQQPRVVVSTVDPTKMPDRWQGLEALDMLAIGSVGENELTPEQQSAIHDYVTAGGTLVVTGGVNWNRLTSPFYAALLPVQVTGARVLNSASALSAYVGGAPPAGAAIPICNARAKAGAKVIAAADGSPLIATGRKGAGKVVFLAFDPSLEPFRGWDRVGDLWKKILLDERRQGLMPAFTGDAGDSTLANTPYAISQLDIPAFYKVALFLLAYIIVLVPVNYYCLRAWDRKEYAWLTTPAIVAVFSIGAYLMAYGFKGGSTLAVKVSLIEAHSGQSGAPAVSYAGIFSPRKTDYDIQLAADDAAARVDAASTLFSEPVVDESQPGAGMRISQEDVQKVEAFPVDMWAMRVVKAQGITRLGKGLTATFQREKNRWRGAIRNDSTLTLEDCHVVAQGRVIPVDNIPPGGQAVFDSDTAKGGATYVPGATLPAALRDNVAGTADMRRVKTSVLQALAGASYNGQGAAWMLPNEPILFGWVKEDRMRLSINGQRAREQNATLFVLHMEPSSQPAGR